MVDLSATQLCRWFTWKEDQERSENLFSRKRAKNISWSSKNTEGFYVSVDYLHGPKRIGDYPPQGGGVPVTINKFFDFRVEIF